MRQDSVIQYYRESFFAKDSLYHPELPIERQGDAGEPVPYTIAGDNLIVSLLLLCLIMTLITLRQSYRFFMQHAKRFFYVTRENVSEVSETGKEFYYQLFLVVQASLLFSVLFMLLASRNVHTSFIIENYEVIGIYTVVFLAYFLLKSILYDVVNITFFDGKKNKQWKQSYLLLISFESILLLPQILLVSFFDLTVQAGIIYMLSLLFLIKMLSLYKSYNIFFRQSGAFLQIILYFCALEIVPLSVLWTGLELINSILTINF